MTTEMPGETDTPDAVASEMADGDENPVAAAIAAAEEIPDPTRRTDRASCRRSWRTLRPGGVGRALVNEKRGSGRF